MVPTNASTRYEIIIEGNNKKFRVMFSARKGKYALGDALFAIPQVRRVEIFNEIETNGVFAWNKKSGEYVTTDGVCKLKFSGATERDIKNIA